jgi:hypothetical protein
VSKRNPKAMKKCISNRFAIAGQIASCSREAREITLGRRCFFLSAIDIFADRKCREPRGYYDRELSARGNYARLLMRRYRRLGWSNVGVIQFGHN